MGAEMKWLEIITPEIIFVGGQSDLLLSDGVLRCDPFKKFPFAPVLCGFCSYSLSSHLGICQF